MNSPAATVVECVSQSPRDVKAARLAFLERALKFDPLPEYRKQIVREYLALTEPEPKEIDF